MRIVGSEPVITCDPRQDELDELERLLLREFAQSEMSRTIASSCQNLSSGVRRHQSENFNKEESGRSEENKKRFSSFAEKFGKRIFEKEQKKSQMMRKFAAGFANKITAERSDVLNKAASIAKTCGSPYLVNNKRKLLKAFVLHMAARIITEQKLAVSKARVAKDQVDKLDRLNKEFTRGFVKRYMDKEKSGTPAPGAGRGRTRSRCYSDHSTSGVYDLNQFTYPSSTSSSRRLFSRPLQILSPEPTSFNANVQRRPWSSYAPRCKSASPERGSSSGAKYRFPAIKKYGSLRSKDSNLIDLDK